MKRTHLACLLALSSLSSRVHATVPEGAQETTAGGRARIDSVDELPPTTYRLDLPLEEFVASDEAVVRFSAAVCDDIERMLVRYEIEDRELLHELRRTALLSALLAERWDTAAGHLALARKLEEREDLRATAGLHWEAWILAQRDVDAQTEPAVVEEAFASRLRQLTLALDWELVHRELKRRHARMGFLGAGLLHQAMSSALGDAVGGGDIAGRTAREFLPLLAGVRLLLPLKETVKEVYGEYLSANDRALVDIWTDRLVSLDPAAALQKVRLAVWDTGSDPDVFAKQLWRNPNETVNGVDDDGNGFVDDVHGIAYDARLRPTTELLSATDPDEEQWKEARSYSRGLSDVGASIDSPQARRLQRKLARIDASEVQTFLSLLQHYAHYSHGTHVAGIAVAGNPFAELVVARVGLDHRVPGDRMTLAWAHRFAAMCLDTVDYFKTHGVRVVNMSWAFGISEIDDNLRDTGFAGTAAERSAHAEAIHAVLASGIAAALRSAPEILFVCGAGNSGGDSSLDRFTPSCLSLANLVTIGGVDRSGGTTAFTSFGDHVSLYANGFMVESFLPGGDRAPMSGTSMSSPQVANLAAKLLAYEPTLTPPELIARMFACADPMEFAGRAGFLLNPKAALEPLIAGR